MHPISLRSIILALTMTLLLQTSDFAFAQQAGRGAGPGPGPGAGLAATTLTIFETDDFSGSGICALCHSRLTDEAGTDVSNDAQWRSTMMANAAKDPLWQAKISAEVVLESANPEAIFNRRKMQPLPYGHGPLPGENRRNCRRRS